MHCITHPDFSYYEQAKEYIYNHVNLIFESELKAWHEDESGWPKKRDLNMFKEWFDVEIHQQVIDFVNQKYVRSLNSSDSAEPK